MENKILGYKIRRKADGLYSCGGMLSGWHSRGKTWNSRAGLHNHFAVVREAAQYRAQNAVRREGGDPWDGKEGALAVELAKDNAVAERYKDCEIVAVVEAESVPMHEYLASIYKPKRKKG